MSGKSGGVRDRTPTPDRFTEGKRTGIQLPQEDGPASSDWALNPEPNVLPKHARFDRKIPFG